MTESRTCPRCYFFHPPGEPCFQSAARRPAPEQDSLFEIEIESPTTVMTVYPSRLYQGHPPAQVHSPTSVAAARAAEPRAGTARARVLDVLRAHPEGLTDEQIQTELDMSASTQRPRRVELVQLGLVRDSGRTALTASKHRAVVWVARG
jgi:hypothetical protein